VALVPLLHGRRLRVFILVVILLGGFFAILYFGQPHSAPVEASATGRKAELPTTQPPQVSPKEPVTETAPFKTGVPHRVAGSTYLQLSAVRREGAERLTDELRKKNFEAAVSEIDGKPGLFRVLVGPVSETGVGQLRADLERAGFLGNAAIRRSLAESNPANPGSAISLSARTGKEEASYWAAGGQTYMELSAAPRESAQLLVDALRQKKFNAMATEIMEKPGLFRVLVGPVKDTGVGIAQLRADLERAGFPGNAAIRRTTAESDSANPSAVKSLSAGATKEDESNPPIAGPAYLEFPATSQQTAEIIVDALREKGFEASASETEDPPGGFHVSIRPKNNTSIDQLRADLERAGFHGNAAILRISK
jgi:SPOR domain